jgi:hypothetical protein
VIKDLKVKIDQVIVLHLYNNKQVTLQGIGTFSLDPSVSLPADTQKELVIPENAITFEYNPKATEDESLIDSIVQHTTKIKPLASADLDSFLMLGRQFLNIGKPFTLDGLGTLDKAQAGQLIFIPGQFITPKIESPNALKENVNEESSGLFNDYNRKPDDTGKKILAVVATVVVIGLIAWAIYHFIFSDNSADEENTLAGQTNVVADSSMVETDSVPQLTVTDTSSFINEPENEYTFRVILQTTKNKNAVVNRMNKLNSWGHHAVVYTTDSVNYKLAELFELPLSDTVRVKDSLSKLYRTPVFIEVK